MQFPWGRQAAGFPGLAKLFALPWGRLVADER